MSAPSCPVWCEGHPTDRTETVHTAKLQAAYVDLGIEQVEGGPPSIYLDDDEVIAGLVPAHAIRLATALLAAVHEVDQ